MRTPRAPFGMIGAVLLVGLVALLAVLQYRWLGQVSQAEREQLRRSLDARAREFADEFDSEISRLYLALQLSRDALDASDWGAFAARFDRWRAEARHPQLVRAIYIAQLSGETQVLRPYDEAARAFAAPTYDWPPQLRPLRDRMAVVPPAPVSGQVNAAHFFATTFLPVASDVPALVVPVWRHVATTSGLASFTLDRADAVVVAALDGDYLRRSLVPALVARHFPEREGDSYRVAVVSGSDAVVFSRGFAPGAVHPAQADLVAPFFTVRLDAVRDLLPGSANPPNAPMGDRLAVIVQHRETTGSAHVKAGPAGTQVRLVPPGWRLVLAHASGSLDAAVQRARRRNLWLVFGILGVLAAGVVMVVLNGRRAARLATQQMDFVATVSHELRTPLAVIRSAAQNLSAGVVSEPDRAKRYGELIEEEGRRLTEMVEQVLEYARLTGAPAAPPRQPMDVAALAIAVAESCRPLCDDEGVTLDVSVEPGVPTVIAGDEAGLRRALHNLLTNALKHGAEGRWVGMAVGRVQGRRGPEVRIEVRDRGRGIDRADLDHVFEPFFRGRRAVAEQVRGNGLGLGLAKRVVEAHGGRVAVESAPGKGATFTVYLPAIEAEQPS